MIWPSCGSSNPSGPGSCWRKDSQISALDSGVAGSDDQNQSLLILACHLAASPVVLTDAEFDNALTLNS